MAFPLPDLSFLENEDQNVFTNEGNLKDNIILFTNFEGDNEYPTLTPTQFVKLLQNPLSSQCEAVVILDTRFFYEYKGGKIKNALNILNRQDIYNLFHKYEGKNVHFVFHCEFSKDRSKAILKFFRKYDRSLHMKDHPNLTHKNIFLLEGGFSRFHLEYPEFCEGKYIRMRENEFVENKEIKKCHSYFKNEFKTHIIHKCNSQPNIHENNYILNNSSILIYNSQII